MFSHAKIQSLRSFSSQFSLEFVAITIFIVLSSRMEIFSSASKPSQAEIERYSEITVFQSQLITLDSGSIDSTQWIVVVPPTGNTTQSDAVDSAVSQIMNHAKALSSANGGFLDGLEGSQPITLSVTAMRTDVQPRTLPHMGMSMELLRALFAAHGPVEPYYLLRNHIKLRFTAKKWAKSFPLRAPFAAADSKTGEDQMDPSGMALSDLLAVAAIHNIPETSAENLREVLAEYFSLPAGILQYVYITIEPGVGSEQAVLGGGELQIGADGTAMFTGG